MELQNPTTAQTDLTTALIEQVKSLESNLAIALARCDQYSQAYESLLHQLNELKRYRFGKKSERFIDPDSPQLSLLDSHHQSALSGQSVPVLAESENITKMTGIKKKKTSKKEIPTRIVVIPLDDAQKICSCGNKKTVIRYETKNYIHYQPAVFEMIEERREIAICSNSCKDHIVIAPKPLHILPKIKASEELLSFLVVSKLEDRQPLYHLEKQLLERHGLDCSRQTMARWMIELMSPMQPLYNLLKDYLIEDDIASCDATTHQVLKEPNRAAEKKSYVYCMRGGPPDKSVILYDYNYELHKQFLVDWFAGFEGYLHVDADNFFELIGETVKLSKCNAHARRKFEAVATATKGKGLAKEALRFFKALYKVERDAKNNNLNSKEIYELRQSQSKKIMDKFLSWLEQHYPTVLPQSPLGKAMNYCIKHWAGLTRYLEDGRLSIDNNHTEREIKPFVISRKNFLFSDTMAGADALCMHMGFIRTAKLHGLEPYRYYVQLLKSLPHCKTVEDYEKLLPWNIAINYDEKN